MRIVITSATEKEILLIKQGINPNFLEDSLKSKVSFIETGIGLLASCYYISKLLYELKPDLIIQAGIAGAFDTKVALAEVVIVKEEILADTGVEEDGSFIDLFDMNLLSQNSFPFYNKRLINPQIEELNFLKLDMVTGITVNEITTCSKRVEQYKANYDPAIESMEGASLHYCCLQTNTPFIQIRAISNFIGERDKSKWNFKDSLKNLSQIVLEYLDHLSKNEIINIQKSEIDNRI